MFDWTTERRRGVGWRDEQGNKHRFMVMFMLRPRILPGVVLIFNANKHSAERAHLNEDNPSGVALLACRFRSSPDAPVKTCAGSAAGSPEAGHSFPPRRIARRTPPESCVGRGRQPQAGQSSWFGMRPANQPAGRGTRTISSEHDYYRAQGNRPPERRSVLAAHAEERSNVALPLVERKKNTRRKRPSRGQMP